MLKGLKHGLREARPSPALVVAFMALLVALGGTAGALSGKNQIDNNDLKKNSVDSANIVKNQVKGGDVLESSLTEVPLADNGVQGYARIEADGDLSPAAPALNITGGNITTVSPGRYCFNGLPFTPRSISVTGDATAATAGDNIVNGAVTPGGSCPGTEQASVETRDDDPAAGAAFENSAFYVVFY